MVGPNKKSLIFGTDTDFANYCIRRRLPILRQQIHFSRAHITEQGRLANAGPNFSLAIIVLVYRQNVKSLSVQV